MNVHANTRIENKIQAGYEVSRFGIGVTAALAALIGLWGMACMIGGLAAGGPVALIKGFFSAITGI